MKTAKQLVQDSKHFCVLPWIHFHGWPDRRVMPCCIADSDAPVSKFEDDSTILDMMNSDEFKKMRKAMLVDEPYEACKRCYELEDNGTWTLRQSQNMVRGASADTIDLIEMTNEDGSIDEFKMKYMDIRFSNLCNFKCRSCGPGCSNLHGEEKKKLIEEHVFITRFGRKETLVNNNDTGEFMRQLRPYLNDVEECYFAGGEILVTPEHYECLDYWIENDIAKNVRLNYTTNMSRLTYTDKSGERDLFELWKHFPNMEMWASIDAIGEQGELIRKGFKWDKVKENLFAIREKAPHIKLGITPTISSWNVFIYDKMFDWFYENDFISSDNPPRLNILTFPPQAAITALPFSMRKELVLRYKEYVAKFSSNVDDEHLLNGFKVLIQTLWSGNDDKNLLTQFFEINDEYDEIRNESISEIIPELERVREWTKS